MVSAFVLINTEIGSERRVLEQLRTIDGVQEAHELRSVYDIAAKVYAESVDQLKETIMGAIKKIPNAVNFLTLLTVADRRKEQPVCQDMQKLRQAMLSQPITH